MTTLFYQPTLTLDELTIICAALDQRSEWAEKAALDMHTRNGYQYFEREARVARRIYRQLFDAPVVDLDDMERESMEREV